MSQCYSVKTEIDGEEKEICLTHAEGNDAFRKDIEAGNIRSPTETEVLNAVKHYVQYGDGGVNKPTIEGFDPQDLTPILSLQINIGKKK